MIRFALALFAVIVMVFFVPALEDASKYHRFSPKVRKLCALAPQGILWVYLLATLYITLLSRQPNSIYYISLDPFAPFKRAAHALQAGVGKPEEYLTSQILNILLYVPLGYLLALVFPTLRNIHIFLLGITLSIFTEGIQLIFHMGFCEISDLFSNILGTLCGLILARIQQKE